MSVSDVTRTELHAISDSNSELLVMGEKKRAPRKTKQAMVEPPVATVSVSNAPTLQTSPSVPVDVNQDSRELVEMCSMFQEIKGLTERNAAYVELIAKNEQARLDAVHNLPVASSAELEGTSGLLMTDNANMQLNYSNGQLVNGELKPWSVFQTQSEDWQTDEEIEDGEYYIDDLVFVSEPQPCTAVQCEKDAEKALKARAEQPEPTPSTSATATQGVVQSEDGKQRPVFTLSSNLCAGTLHSELKELYKNSKRIIKKIQKANLF